MNNEVAKELAEALLQAPCDCVQWEGVVCRRCAALAKFDAEQGKAAAGPPQHCSKCGWSEEDRTWITIAAPVPVPSAVRAPAVVAAQRGPAPGEFFGIPLDDGLDDQATAVVAAQGVTEEDVERSCRAWFGIGSYSFKIKDRIRMRAALESFAATRRENR